MRATIGELIDLGIIVAHKDGNYGSLYPRTGDFGERGTIFLTAKNVGDDGRIDFESAQRLNDDKASIFKFGWIKNNDVLLSHNATVGRVAVVGSLNERALVGTSLTYFTLDKSRLLPGYFASFLKGRDFQSQLEAVMSYSTRNQVPITIQKQLSVDIPPFEKQKAIAHILGTLDDKIEMNRKTNETLEAMAKALFKSWFVDFDPVRAKAEGRPTVLPAEVSNLFPDSFEDSELGEIPSGWAGDTFGSFTTPKRGRMITKKDTIEGSIPVVAGGMEPAYYHNKSNVDSPVVTISASGANAGFVNLYFESIWASDCSYISKTESKFPFTCYLFLISSQKRIYDAQHGGVQPHINPGDLARLDFINATENIFEVFEGTIRPIFAKASSAIKESKQLENLRDALLPKLISGEIRIPDAEKMLEEVGV